MFTGLVCQCGHLADEPRSSEQGGVKLKISYQTNADDVSPCEDLTIGASLAVAGVCLTIVEKAKGVVTVELAPETLRRTTLGGLQRGSKVNLEPAMRLGDVLGGHWVQGHVDETTQVLAREDLEEHCEMAFALPESMKAFVVEKGSVTLDGVSLTVATLEDGRFTVALIPHTLAVTTLGELAKGDRVNLEVDILAKYVHQSLSAAGRLAVEKTVGE